MDREEIRAKIKEIIANIANLSAEEIGDHVSLKDDLGLDSLSMLEIAVDVDFEFKLDLPQEKLSVINTVQDAVELAQEYLHKKEALLAY